MVDNGRAAAQRRAARPTDVPNTDSGHPLGVDSTGSRTASLPLPVRRSHVGPLLPPVAPGATGPSALGGPLRARASARRGPRAPAPAPRSSPAWSPTPRRAPHSRTRKSSSSRRRARSRAARARANGLHDHRRCPPAADACACGSSATARRTVRSPRATARRRRSNFALLQRTAQLDQVVVTGTGGARSAARSATSSRRINADERARRSRRRERRAADRRAHGRAHRAAGTGQVGTGAQLRVRAVEQPVAQQRPDHLHRRRAHGRRAPRAARRSAAAPARAGSTTSTPRTSRASRSSRVPRRRRSTAPRRRTASSRSSRSAASSGKAQWNFTTRQGTNWLANPEGRAGMLYGRRTHAGEIVSFNLYQHEIERQGADLPQRPQPGLPRATCSGGTDASRYYLSASYDNDVGVVAWNWDKKFTGRANIDACVGQKLRLQGKRRLHPRPHPSRAGRRSTPTRSASSCGARRSRLGRAQRGFDNTPPEEWYDGREPRGQRPHDDQLHGDYKPWSWFTNRLVDGARRRLREQLARSIPRQPLGSLDPLGNNGLGRRTSSARTATSSRSTTPATSKYDGARRAASSRRRSGCQHYRSELSQITATATTSRRRPITTISSGATTTRHTRTFTANATRRHVRASRRSRGTTACSSPPRCAATTTARSARTSRRRTTRRSARRGW